MALATVADVEVRLGRQLSASELPSVEALILDAETLVVGYCRQEFDPVTCPTAVVVVIARMAARVVKQGDIVPGLESATEGAGPFSRGFKYGGGSSGDVWLSAADKMMLRPHRKGGGLASVQLVGERYNIEE